MSILRLTASLRVRLLAILVLVVALAAGVPALLSAMLGKRAANQGAQAHLAASLAGFRMQQPERLAKLGLMARVLATDPVLVGYLSEAAAGAEPIKLLDLLEGYQDRLAFDAVAVSDTGGTLLAAVGIPLADAATLEATLAVARKNDRARGAWNDRSGLFHVAALPMVRDFELLGFVIVGLRADDALARQLASLGGEDVIFTVPGTGARAVPVAGTAAPAHAAAVVDALAARGEVLARTFERGETVASVGIEVEGSRLVAGIEPLRDAGGHTVAALVATAAPAHAAPGLGRIPLASVLAGLAALAAGSALLVLALTHSQRPWQRLAGLAEGLARGEAAAVPSDLEGDAGRVGAALDRMANDRQQQNTLAGAVAVAESVPPSAQALRAAGARGDAHTTTLLAAELRRYADPRLGYDAEVNLEHFVVDVRRLRAAIRDRQGRIAAVAGHRVLAVFEGEGASFRALAAAAEASRALSVGESVFDQPEPPAMALAAGSVVHGRVAWGTGAGPALLGLPMQQLESLLREGTPGEICLPKNIYGELASAFSQAGAERQPQRGVMSPQSLFSIPAEVAAKVTGVADGPVRDPAPGRRSFADVAIGMTLAGRFEIQDELGADSHSVRFEVRDRERGVLAMLALLRPQLIAAPEDLEQMAGALRRLRGLDHPHVISVWDFGEAEGLPYVLMPFIPGVRLRRLLAAGALVPSAALGMARQVASGLAAAHGAGVLHGDLRPEQVLVQGSGHVRIGGFAVGAMAPTPAAAAYRAPELVAGGAPGVAGDLYAFGALLYESLAGRAPTVGASPAEIQKRQLASPPEPLGEAAPEVPPAFAAQVMQCLARDPSARPASFDALAAELETLRA